MVNREEFEQASRRGTLRRETGPIARAARYDRRRGRLIVSLDDGLELTFPAGAAQGLAGAAASDLAVIEITPTGLGLHWPRLDVDLYLPGLLQGALGSERWMAMRLGTMGGRSRSAAKTAAARENGKRGGRPRKTASR